MAKFGKTARPTRIGGEVTSASIIPVAREYFGKRGVPIVPEHKARRGGIARPYYDESQRRYRVRAVCIAAKYSCVTGMKMALQPNGQVACCAEIQQIFG